MSNSISQKAKKYLITLVGPTAVGKTAAAIELAQKFDCPIISADSRQFFKEMSIGTAKPTAEELSSAEHHFVDFISIHEEYSAGQFERDALEKLESFFVDQDYVIMSGGSGLYVNAVLDGFDDLPQAPEIRKELMTRLENEGLEPLFDELQTLDPTRAKSLDPKNTQRVIRSLEVCLTSGKPYSGFTTKSKSSRNFTPIIIGLNRDREELYNRINSRVDSMMEAGLVEEVKELESLKHLNALKTVGYQELFDFFTGDKTLEEAIEAIKQSTRRFAKRQITWFKRMEGIEWFEPKDMDAVADHILTRSKQ